MAKMHESCTKFMRLEIYVYDLLIYGLICAFLYISLLEQNTCLLGICDICDVTFGRRYLKNK